MLNDSSITVLTGRLRLKVQVRNPIFTISFSKTFPLFLLLSKKIYKSADLPTPNPKTFKFGKWTEKLEIWVSNLEIYITAPKNEENTTLTVPAMFELLNFVHHDHRLRVCKKFLITASFCHLEHN